MSVITGLVMGFVFGDLIFPELKAAYGTPHTDIVLGLAGAFFAAVIYEIVTYIRDRT